jgi:type VI secretion system FHA domain protein
LSVGDYELLVSIKEDRVLSPDEELPLPGGLFDEALAISKGDSQPIQEELDLENLFKDWDVPKANHRDAEPVRLEPLMPGEEGREGESFPGRTLESGEVRPVGGDIAHAQDILTQEQELGGLWGDSTERGNGQPLMDAPGVQTRVEIVPDATTGVHPPSRGDSKEWLKLFLEGAGMEGLDSSGMELSPETLRTIGAVFRELVLGLWTILRARTELKSDIRLEMTLLRPTENNPFKFSPRVEDVLRLLVVGRHPSYLNAIDAVREGFADVMNHQMAFTAGVQAALMDVLQRFDPQHFLDKSGKGFLFQQKLESWNAYVEAYANLLEEVKEGFFGEAFSRAYEEQMKKLRATHDAD